MTCTLGSACGVKQPFTYITLIAAANDAGTVVWIGYGDDHVSVGLEYQDGSFWLLTHWEFEVISLEVDWSVGTQESSWSAIKSLY